MLSQIRLQHFKSFRDASAPLGDLSLIVGTNASGKSNIREALRVLHGIGLGYSIAEVLGERYGPGGILQWRGIRGGATEAGYLGQSRFRLSATVKLTDDNELLPGDYHYTIEIDVSDLTTGPRVVAERLQSANRFVYDSHPENDPVEQSGEHQIRIRFPRGGNNKKHGRTLALSSARPVLAQLRDRRHEPAAVRKLCEAISRVFSAMRFLDLDPDAMRRPSQPGQTVLGDRGENLSSVLQAICQQPAQKQTLLAWLKALTPMDATDFAYDLVPPGRVLVSLVDATGFRTSALSASDGTLRFLALVAALLSQDSGRIYFFEEFDNGIHPTRLHLLLDLVQRACRTLGVQVIGTTHNPALLAFLDAPRREHALLVYRRDDRPDSRLVRIMDLPRAAEVLLTQDLGRLHQTGWLEDAAIFAEDESATDDH